MKRLLLLPLAALVLAAPAPAAKVKVWQHTKPADYDKAQLKQAVVTSEGTLRLARQLRPLADLKAAFIWDVVEDNAGNLLVATGDEGKLFKVGADGKATVLYAAATDSQILCLTKAPDGTIYAGTGPTGKIIRIAPGGEPQVFADKLDAYVWSLAYDPATQNLYAGTGPKGKIYQVTAAGKSSVFYATRQEHILALAFAKNTLYAGTDKGGLVYRIDPKGKGFVLYQAHQSEVRSLLVAGDALYAGTSSPNLKRPGAGAPMRTTPGALTPMGTPAISPASEKSESKTPAQIGAKPPSTIATDEVKGTPAPAPTKPVVGDNSLYRINVDGTVRELFRDKIMILSLLRHQGQLLVGTGLDGQLFEIDESTKEKIELARLDHGVIQCLLQRKDGSIVLGAGDPGKLYVLEDKFAAKGTVVSEVLDAKIISFWGAMNWKATAPAGTSVTVALRSGNVAEPDATWSDWSAEEADLAGAKPAVPAARYLQYRVTLTTKDPQATPEFRHVTLRYRTTNQPPEITGFDVPDLDATPQENPKKFRLKWNAVDPNEDEVTFAVHFRKEGWKDWVLLEDNLEKKDFEWDTTTIPSGMYQFKLTASDRRDNSAEDARAVDKASPLVPVTHLPPAVTVKLAGFEGDRAIIAASAADPLVRLTEAAYSIDGKRWSNIFPSDGLFDSKSEAFRFKTDALRPGTHILVLRVRDAAGNLGSGDVVFAAPAK
jgi:hypothetical protein